MEWANQYGALLDDHRQFIEIYTITHDLLTKQELTQTTEQE